MPIAPADFHASLSDAQPPEGLREPLQALWWAARDWERAHDVVSARQGDSACDLVHAHLHRRRGDDSAASWYADAGETVSDLPIEAEWRALVDRFLAAR